MNELPVAPIRGKLNMIVRSYAQRTHTAYDKIWSQLYRELYYRCHYDVKARCRHSRRKPLDQIETDGKIEVLYVIASAILV